MNRLCVLFLIAIYGLMCAGCSDKKAITPSKQYEAPKSGIGAGSPKIPNPGDAPPPP